MSDLPIGGPAALLAALDRARSGRMTDIVSTIQREQDEIIRAPLTGVLVVQGGPGTGKTAVALHRAAYLLYTHRFPLERQGVLVVGPNPLFLRYIEQVLPSLGETGVTLSTVSGLVPEIRIAANGPADVARLKGDARMAKVIARAVRTRQRPLSRGRGRPLRGPVPPPDGRGQPAHRRHGPPPPGHPQRPPAPGRAGRGPAAGRPGPPVPADPGRGRARVGHLLPRATRIPRSSPRTSSTSRTSRARCGGSPSWPRPSTACGPGSPPTSCSTTSSAPRPSSPRPARGALTPEEQQLLLRPRSASFEEVAWTPADAALVDEARHLLGPAATARPTTACASTGTSWWTRSRTCRPCSCAC